MAGTRGRSTAAQTYLQFRNQIVDKGPTLGNQRQREGFGALGGVEPEILERTLRRTLAAMVRSQPFFFQGGMRLYSLCESYFLASSYLIKSFSKRSAILKIVSPHENAKVSSGKKALFIAHGFNGLLDLGCAHGVAILQRLQKCSTGKCGSKMLTS
jgi:hypothetical protein